MAIGDKEPTLEKRLGKITKVKFGHGGYQDAMFGLDLTFESKTDSWGVCKFISGGWNESIQVTEYTKWSEEDRSKQRVDMCKEIDKILADAKVDSIDKLINKPVEVTFENYSTLKEWRILTEVI